MDDDRFASCADISSDEDDGEGEGEDGGFWVGLLTFVVVMVFGDGDGVCDGVWDSV